MAYDTGTVERVRRALAGRRDVVERPLMGGLCFMVSGNMCCSVSGRGGLLVRVSQTAYEVCVRKPHVTPMQMGKRTMRGFVRVLPEGYRTAAQLRGWLKLGVDCALTLPSKRQRA
jgi:hypothetical protein